MNNIDFFIHCNRDLVIRSLYSFVSHSSRECYPHKPVSGLCLRELSEFCLPLVTLKQAQPLVSQLNFLIIIFVSALINREFMQPRWQSLREPEKTEGLMSRNNPSAYVVSVGSFLCRALCKTTKMTKYSKFHEKQT